MKKALKWIGIVLGVIIVIVGGYVIYVFSSYDRVPDNQKLKVRHGGRLEEQAVPMGKELTVTSSNIGFGAYSDDYTFFMDGGKESRARSVSAIEENIEGSMRAVGEEDPDFALVQEVDVYGTRSLHVNERELVTSAISYNRSYDHVFAQNYDSPYLMYPVTKPHGANQSGIMSFSAYPVNSALRRKLPIETGLSKVIDLDRCYSKLRVNTADGKKLVLYNFHFSAYTANPETAENQLKMVVKDMRNEYDAGNYCLAGGDFNADLLGDSPKIFGTPKLEDNWAKPVNMDLFDDKINLEAPFDENAMVASCRNPDKPYEKGDFVVTIDGFIRSKNIEVIDSAVIDTGFKYSDHNPVVMHFKLSK